MRVVDHISFEFHASFANMHVSSAVHTVVLAALRAKVLINIFWLDKNIPAPSSGTPAHVIALVNSPRERQCQVLLKIILSHRILKDSFVYILFALWMWALDRNVRLPKFSCEVGLYAV